MYENYLNAYIAVVSDGTIDVEVGTKTLEEKLSAAIGALNGALARVNEMHPADRENFEKVLDSYK